MRPNLRCSFEENLLHRLALAWLFTISQRPSHYDLEDIVFSSFVNIIAVCDFAIHFTLASLFLCFSVFIFRPSPDTLCNFCISGLLIKTIFFVFFIRAVCFNIFTALLDISFSIMAIIPTLSLTLIALYSHIFDY